MSTVKRIAKNTLVLILTNVVTRVLSLILIIYIARYLGDVGFGKFSFAVSFAGLFVIFSDMGLKGLLIREVARDKSVAGKFLGNFAIIKIILSLITFALIFAIINLMKYPHDTTIAVYILSLSLIINSSAQLFISIFRAFEKMEYEALTMTIEKLIVVSLALFVLFRGYGLIEVALVFLIASTFNFLFSFLITIKKFTKPKLEIDLDFWKHSIRTALPFALALGFAAIYAQIDIIMLSIMKGDAVVGWYNAAYKLTAALVFIPAMFTSSLFPVMSKFFKSSKESLKIAYTKSFTYLTVLAMPIAVGTTILADRFILLFYGSTYTNSIIALQILAWALVATFLNYVLAMVMISLNRQKILSFYIGGCVLLNVFLNLLLIPKFSYIGASLATVITEALLCLCGFYFVSKYLYKLPVHRIIIKPLVASLIMGIFILYFKEIRLILLLLSAIMLYFTTLYITKTFSEDDKELFIKIFR